MLFRILYLFSNTPLRYVDCSVCHLRSHQLLQSVAVCFFSLSKPETLTSLTRDWAPELKRCAGAGEGGRLPSLIVGIGGEGERREVSPYEAHRAAFGFGADAYRELAWPLTQQSVRALFSAALAAAFADNERKSELRRRLTGDHTLDLANYARFNIDLLTEFIAVPLVSTLILRQVNLETITFENLSLPVLQVRLISSADVGPCSGTLAHRLALTTLDARLVAQQAEGGAARAAQASRTDRPRSIVRRAYSLLYPSVSDP